MGIVIFLVGFLCTLPSIVILCDGTSFHVSLADVSTFLQARDLIQLRPPCASSATRGPNSSSSPDRSR